MRGYQDFTFKAEYAYDYGMPQRLARIDHALSHGFISSGCSLDVTSIITFVSGIVMSLSKYVQEMLLDPVDAVPPLSEA